MDITAKIEKLLQRTVENGCTPEEATTAATMVQKLIAKYHVEMPDTEKSDVDIETVPVTRNWQAVLLYVIAKNMRCEAVHFSQKKGFCKVFGHKVDRQAVVDLYYKLFPICKSGIATEKMIAEGDSESIRGIEASYGLGFCSGVKNAMEVQAKALVLVVPKEVNECVTEQVGKVYTSTIRYSSGRHYNKGFSDGRNSMTQKKIEGGTLCLR